MPLALIRGLTVAALFSAYGALVFLSMVAPRSFERMAPEILRAVRHRLIQLIQLSLVLALLTMLCWLFYESGMMADAPSFRAAIAAVPSVALDTSFGHAILLQLFMMVTALALLAGGRPSSPFRFRLAALATGAATALQAWHSHALAMYGGPSLLLLSDVVHLLSAGAWLGGLLPLLLIVAMAPPKTGATAARAFSGLGKLCVIGVIVSAGFQGWVLVGGFPGLIGSAYGWTAFAKFMLLLVLLVFAAANRYHFAPALLRDDGAAAKRMLIRSLAAQTTAGLLVVFAAGILSSLPPGLHVQPVWPFAKQPSLITIREDAEFRMEVVEAVLALAGAVAVAATGMAMRRIRWTAIMAAVVIAWFAIPHLDLLFVEAYPTSFYHSPTGFTAIAIADGAALYPKHCAGCHGITGQGDGPLAKTLPIPPADLTADHLWGHSDGEMFWWLSHGIDSPEGGLAMPGFAGVLSEDQRWHLIDYIRANNAGISHRRTGAWSQPVKAPSFNVVCNGGKPHALEAFRGKVVRLLFDGSTGAAAAPIKDVNLVTISIVSNPNAAAQYIGCIAQEPSIRRAYSAVSGIAASDFAGAQFLIDPNGWLRDAERAGQRSADPQILLAEIEQICTHPLADKEASHAHHH